MKVNKASLNLELVDEETGEITEKEYDVTELVASKVGTVKKTSSTTKRKKKEEDNDPDPKVTLEDNKLVLNEAALIALDVNEGDRVAVKYEVKNNQKNPIIGSSERMGAASEGTKLTKSHTLSFRGHQNEELAKYGNVFRFQPSGKVQNTFYLIGNGTPEVPESSEEIQEDNDIDIQAEIDNLNNADNEVLPDDLNFTL